MLQAVRYIHRNPLRAGLVKNIGEYPWSSHQGYVSIIDMIKERYGEEKIRREVPLSRDLLPDADRIMEAVCKSYEITTQDLFKMQRGKRNDARNVSIYLIRKLRKDTLNEIGKVFRIDNDSTVSSVLERIKKRMAKDRHLSEQVNKIVESFDPYMFINILTHNTRFHAHPKKQCIILCTHKNRFLFYCKDLAGVLL
ncbi:MAG: hypothetical protein KJ737_27495 [Proteobacteria bacterium]|nr:hypothetical protein [Pseudomonadota bacterium]